MNNATSDTDKTLNFWGWWIIIAVDFTVIVGMIMALSPDFLHDLMISTYYESLFGSNTYETLSAVERDFQSWAYGLIGAIMAGWLIVIGFIAYYAFRRGERWAWWAIVVSMVVWFVLDSYASIAFGMSINMIFNIVSVIVFGIPIIATYRIFFAEANTASRETFTSGQTA